jgi:hypothetical protein
VHYLISAEDLVRLLLLASHLDTDDEIAGILMRVSKTDMEKQAPALAPEPAPPVRPE